MHLNKNLYHNNIEKVIFGSRPESPEDSTQEFDLWRRKNSQRLSKNFISDEKQQFIMLFFQMTRNFSNIFPHMNEIRWELSHLWKKFKKINLDIGKHLKSDFSKGHNPVLTLGKEEQNLIVPSTQNFALRRAKLSINTLHNPLRYSERYLLPEAKGSVYVLYRWRGFLQSSKTSGQNRS